MNKLNDGSITLDIDNHVYNHRDDKDISFTSVTTFVDSFFEPFDEVKVSKHLINNVPKYFDRTEQSLIEEWNKARAYGTEVHLEIEEWIRNGVSPRDIKSKNAKNWIEVWVTKPHIETFSEVIVYSKELAIAGTIDILIMNKKLDEFVLIDWKTSKRIDLNSFKGKTGIEHPAKDIEDCNYNHYSLQLSLYRYILEKYYDIKINRQLIAHIKDDGVESYSTPYMKDVIIEMLDRKIING